MLKIQKICKTAILCLATVICATLAAQDKKRIGVTTFENSTSLFSGERAFGDRMADILVTELMSNRNYDLVERSRLNRIMEEQGLGMTGVLDQSNVAQVGKVAGLDYIVLGNVLDASASEDSTSGIASNLLTKGRTTVRSASFRVSVNVKVIEVESGRIIVSESAEGKKSRPFADGHKFAIGDFSEVAPLALAKVAFKIMRAISPMEPSVLLVKSKEKEVTIDMGIEDGIREGQRLAIVREGEPLYDRNGNLVGVDIIEIAYITISRVEATTAVGKIIKINKNLETKKDYEINRGDLLRQQDRTGGARGIRDVFNRSK